MKGFEIAKAQEVDIFEKIYRVLEYQQTPFGPAPKKVLLGWAETDDSRIPYTLPDAPQRKKDYLNYGKDQEDQYWVREEIPEYWTQKYIEDIAEERYNDDTDWWLKTTKKGSQDIPLAEPRMLRHMAREWDRRKNGIWILINGQPTYLTGNNYFYLQYYRLDGPYPGYRDRDRRFWYVWQAVEDDDFCYGLHYIKHRRDGATYRGCSIATNIATRIQFAVCAIQSNGFTHAQSLFKKKIVPAVQELPMFFKPVIKNSTSPGEYFEFDNPSRRGKNMNKRPLREGLKSWLGITATKAEGKGTNLDGEKLRFYFRDETGKHSPDRILDTWGIIKPTLQDDGVVRKAYFPTTVEQPSKTDDYGVELDECREMWETSDPALRLRGGLPQTISGLWRYFTPAWDGLNEAFIGKYGESIVHKPTSDQVEYLKQKKNKDGKTYWEIYGEHIYQHGGSLEYLRKIFAKAKEGGDREYFNTRKKFPLTPEDAFRVSVDEHFLNLQNIFQVEESLRHESSLGSTSSLAEELTVRGDLKWIGGFMGGVKFVPNKNNGRFIFHKDYLLGSVPNKHGWKANEVIRRHGRAKVAPTSMWRGVIGLDPFKVRNDQARSKKYELSFCGMHGFLRYDPAIDGHWDESNPEAFKDYYTHNFVFEYLNRPADPSNQYEDALKAAMYLNFKIHPEINVHDVVGWFIDVGAAEYLLHKPKVMHKPGANVSKSEHLGTFSTDSTHEIGLTRIMSFVELFAYPNKCPFPRTWEQWRSCNPYKLGKYDLVVSSMFALVGANPNFAHEEKVRKFDDIDVDLLEMLGIRSTNGKKQESRRR